MLIRLAVVAALFCALPSRSLAQDAAASESPAAASESAVSEVPPPPPASPPPPPPGYAAGADASAQTTGSWQGGNATGPGGDSDRRRFNIWLGLGFGDAVGCGNEDPDSPCAVDGAATIGLGADYRFHPNFGVGLEISGWSFSVSDRWLGQLDGDQKSADISASSLSIIGRWYWFDRGMFDPYLQFGLGIGGMEANVTNDSDQTYTYSASGTMWNLGVGGDFHVTPWLKLGPQLLAALLLGNEVCEKLGSDGDSVCRKPEKNDKGEQEGNALAWRFMLVGTVMLGER